MNKQPLTGSIELEPLSMASPSKPRQLTEMLALAVIYILAAHVGQLLSIPPGNVSAVWIPSGVILVAVLLRGYWIWPGIWLGAFLGNVWAYIDFDSSYNIVRALFSGTLNGFGDVIGTLVGAYLIRRFTGSVYPLASSSHMATFIFYGVLLSSAISATFGVSSLAIANFIDWHAFLYTWATWCIGDAVGILVIAPLLLHLFSGYQYQRVFSWPEFLVYLLVYLAILLTGLNLLPFDTAYQLPLYIALPVLIWSILRLGTSISLFSVLLLGVLAIYSTALGFGPFADYSADISLLQLQLFIATVSITILLLNAVVREREVINQQLVSTHDELEKLVESRTQQLQLTSSELGIAQKRLLHSQKIEALGTLAGGIAHDFNNILNIIMGSTEMLQSQRSAQSNDNKGDDDKWINNILSSAKRAVKLVEQILLFSQKAPDSSEIINLSQAVKDAMKILRASIPSNIRIVENIEDDELHIFGDTTKIQQIVINLCTNAYQAMPEQNGMIEVNLKKIEDCTSLGKNSADCVMLSVSDNGEGIAENIIDRVFDPFFTTRGVGKGTGLGLSVVHGVVENHQGTIEVESKLGCGTDMRIYFPLSSMPLSEKLQAKEELSNVENKTILIVDDEESIIAVYTESLKNAGYNVISCYRGSDALEIFRENQAVIDVVVTDLSMPEMTGKQLIKALLEIRPDIKIIMTTGYGQAEQKQEMQNLHIYKILSKPVMPTELKKIIHECIASDARK